MAFVATVSSGGIDQGIRGVHPEPKAGFRTARARDEALQDFSNQVWQRHTASHSPDPHMWPSSSTFHRNWPAVSVDLIVAAWKVAEAVDDETRLRHPPELGSERSHWLFGVSSCDGELSTAWAQERHTAVAIDELSEELLDPKPPAGRDARQLYADELAAHPAILGDLDSGGAQDGVELVLERANLSTRERMVVRPWLSGDDARAIAAELGMRSQSVVLVLSNAQRRLEDVERWAPRRARAPARTVVGAAAAFKVGAANVDAARQSTTSAA